MVMGALKKGLLGFCGYSLHPCRKGRSAININRCNLVCFMMAKKRFFSQNRIPLREKYYICPQNCTLWRSIWHWFPAFWRFCCSLVRAPHPSRGPYAKPNVKWRRWRNSRRKTTIEPRRRTTSDRPRRPSGWSRKTNAMPSVCDAGSAQIHSSHRILINKVYWVKEDL